MTKPDSLPEDSSNYVNSLKKRMKTTSYAKFDAHKRYASLNNSSLFALTASSLLLIFISIINKYSLLSIGCAAKVELTSILISITILVLSLVVSLSSYSLKSERFLRSGNEILDLLERLNLLKDNDDDGVSCVVNEYSVQRRNADNHQSFNYRRGRAERKNEEKKDDERIEDEVICVDLLFYWAPIAVFYIISFVSITSCILMLWSVF
jgi:hypothetical protein